MNKLTVTDKQAFDQATRSRYPFEDKIEKRITYIVQKVRATFDLPYDTWYFPDAEEGQLGTFDISDQEVYIIGLQPKKYIPNILEILDINGKILDLHETLPSRWLYEDFETELEQGKIALEAKKAAKKAATAAKRNAKKEGKAEQQLLEWHQKHGLNPKISPIVSIFPDPANSPQDPLTIYLQLDRWGNKKYLSMEKETKLVQFLKLAEELGM